MSKVRAAAAILLLSLLMTLTACGNGEAKMIVGTWKPSPTTKTVFGLNKQIHVDIQC